MGESALRMGGVPPTNSVLIVDPLVSDAATVDQLLPVAVTFMVARPSPVAVTAQVAWPHARVAVPATTVNKTVTPAARVWSAPRAVTVNGVGTPMGTVFMGAVTRVNVSLEPES